MKTLDKVHAQIEEQQSIKAKATEALKMLYSLLGDDVKKEAAVSVPNQRGPIPVPIVKIDPETDEILEMYDSQSQAAKAMSIASGTISNAVNHHVKCHGYYWRRADGKTIIRQSQSIAI